MIASLITLIKHLKPRRYTTLHVEFPLNTDQPLTRELSDSEYLQAHSDEIESKALAVYTILVNTYGIKPKRIRGTIVPVLSASSTPRDKIVITCRVPEDTPIVLINGDCIQMFGGNCVFFS